MRQLRGKKQSATNMLPKRCCGKKIKTEREVISGGRMCLHRHSIGDPVVTVEVSEGLFLMLTIHMLKPKKTLYQGRIQFYFITMQGYVVYCMLRYLLCSSTSLISQPLNMIIINYSSVELNYQCFPRIHQSFHLLSVSESSRNNIPFCLLRSRLRMLLKRPKTVLNSVEKKIMEIHSKFLLF